jgi:hypothetical protein
MRIFENKLHSAGMVRGEIKKSAAIIDEFWKKKGHIGLPLAFGSQITKWIAQYIVWFCRTSGNVSPAFPV